MAKDNGKTKEVLDNLKSMIAAFEQSDNYLNYLRTQKRFHRYSWRNSMLITLANPEATYVKGFQSWLQAGRCVRKGQKGIAILAPRPFTKAETNSKGESVVRSGMYFTTTYVWDVSQTDVIEGHANPFLPENVVDIYAAMTDETGGDLYATLVEHIESVGCPVEVVDTGRADGSYNMLTKVIKIKPGAQLKMLNTLIHEAAHHYAREAVEKFGRDTEEVIVESVAFIVADHFSLDTSQSSVPYVSSWLRSDPKAFEKGMGEIQRLANKLIDAMEQQVAARELIAA